MSELNSPENTPPQQPQHRGVMTAIRERTNWPATIGASIALTLSANAVLHAVDWPEGSFLDNAKHTLLIKEGFDTTSTTDLGTKTHNKTSVVDRPLRSITAHSDFDLQTGAQEYARDFSADPLAGQFTNPGEITKVTDGLEKIARRGGEIRRIKLTGYASAEDDSKNGGLTTPSAKNHELAARRAVVAEQDIREAIAADPKLVDATAHTRFVQGAPVEQELTPREVKVIATAAHDTGFASSKALVEAWNNGSPKVTAGDREMLESILGKARKDSIDVTWHRSGTSVKAIETYCTNYVVTNHRAVTKHHEVPVLPIPIPLFFPIPKLGLGDRRRRKKEADESGGGPEPDQPSTDDTTSSKTAETAGGGSDRMYSRSYEKYLERELRSESRLRRYSRRALGWSALAVVVAGFNVSGKDCHGQGHSPWPVPADFVRDVVRDVSGAGADTEQTFSFGVPFVPSAQIELEHNPGNVWDGNPARPCEKDNGSANIGGGNSAPPRCSTVEINRVNGHETGRQTVYQAPPISRKIVRIKQP